MVDYKPSTATLGTLIGICPNCESMMYRRVAFSKIDAVSRNLVVAFPKASAHVGKTADPFVNGDFDQEAEHDANAQRR